MGSKICMNEVCRSTTSSEWKKGWGLKSGGFATLCYGCGSAYENSVFCDTFHPEESGWRECRICGKRIHCGCIASRFLHEYMDFGGIGCINCAKRLEIHPIQPVKIASEQISDGTFITNGIGDVNTTTAEKKIDIINFSTERLLQLTKAVGASEPGQLFDSNKQEPAERGKHFPDLIEQSGGSSAFFRTPNGRQRQGIRDMYESLSQQSLGFSLSTPLSSSSPVPPSSGSIVEGSEQGKGSLQQGQRARHILPKPPKPSPVSGSDPTKTSASQARVARPPADGRGRNQLLPRYWPKITDQELEQLSGDLKSTIVPLFEKTLSASDAGRIGRLVLPKACAEAYFPTINQSEGIPIKIQDIKGKEWTFQFRFWPNNNSRMYVLEGVTPCIQTLQVQAGDIVTFSRRDPGGQLVIGCRKITSNNDVQGPQTPNLPNGDSSGETSVPGHTENLHSNGGRTSEDSMQRSMQMSDKKKARNIKNKRLLIHSDDAMELKITWEEAQELLRPSPAANPSIVMIEDQPFEEFDEPPIFGKRTIFTSQPSGELEQLAQCDSCSKWRRLPVNALLSAKWTCAENIWDSTRSSCSAPEDIMPREVDAVNGINRDFPNAKRRRAADSKEVKDGEPSGLDALATVAVLGDNIGDMGESSVGATTRHPRHRPGCSCIVCIQPPSGKGKHQPTCKCNVCLTVRRRFKTLMMRKKKRQSEREAELAQEKDNAAAEAGLEKEDIAGHALLEMNDLENGSNQNGNLMDLAEASKAQLDLNCDPHRDDDMLAEAAAGMSLTTLMNAASLPLDMYLGHNSLSNLGSSLLSQAASESEGNAPDDGGATSGDVEQQNKSEDG